MRKHVLITAGPVYGKLDDNKIVSNRSRGTWAARFAKWLTEGGRDDYRVTLLVPDIMKEHFTSILHEYPCRSSAVEILTHSGYNDYREACNKLAAESDAAIMAAAVVNWVPKTPFPGKMPTDLGASRVSIPFVLAPKVIDEMKKANPTLTLIGCKLLFSDDEEALVESAYEVLLRAKCNAVVANDAHIGLRNKFVVHKDRAVVKFMDNFDGLFEHLHALIEDVHYRTVSRYSGACLNLKSHQVFDAIVEKYQDRFVPQTQNSDLMFGSVVVRHFHPDHKGEYYAAPRKKMKDFDAWDAPLVTKIEGRTVHTYGGRASLNAPLLIRHLEKYPEAAGVIHYHAPENDKPDLPNGLFPVAPYAPPGTVRDNERDIPGPAYYISNHGWIIAVDEEGNPI